MMAQSAQTPLSLASMMDQIQRAMVDIESELKLSKLTQDGLKDQLIRVTSALGMLDYLRPRLE